ncbi:Septum formation initiator [Beutenbergia cavernae DSM 12333]|uniref:Septum formation initiator n=1 Tax=Beutenbergia cavernae (strain ATCC BAA-8 / DSM 12333 / CCUG 43141 / JCM 11478 / NBRC 16432 / NCIMB 13614 / HKI 0122) TaxID=471853 RepID=C5C094_BEUC1|nr:Septum formation initiator [Beutenbergia cavernae DSM 12333]
MTLRALVLFVVALVAFIVLMPTLRAYVAQQEQLRDVNAQLADAQARTESLQAEYDRWQDPTYVQSQARERFHMVMPGETMYRVLDPETVTGEDPIGDVTEEAAQEDGALVPDPDRAPWYVTVWDSVQVAGGAGSTD